MIHPEVAEQLVPTEEYQRYMEFRSSEPNPWRADLLSQQLAILDAANTEVTAEEARNLQSCYEGIYRSYHGEPHGNFMGQVDMPEPLVEQLSLSAREWAGAAHAIAGLWHDAVYKQVDAVQGDENGTGAWHPYITSLIGNYASYSRAVEDGRPIFRTKLTEAGRQDRITAMTAHIFGFDEATLKQGIVHNQGGNEFDSALAAAKFLESKGTPLHKIVAVVAGIAATVPFRPARGDTVPDGHMGELAQRVESVLRNGEDRAWDQTNDIMLVAVDLANRDISPFILPDNFAQVINGGRKVKKEEVPELRAQVTNLPELVRAAGLERSAPLLYQWIGSGGGPVPADSVPHFYIPRDRGGRPQPLEAYPSEKIYQQAVVYAERNSSLAALFFQAHEAGIVLAACIASSKGDATAEVPGFVHAESWRDQAEPIPQADAQLTEREQAVYLTLLHGIGQEAVDGTTPVRSPIAGVLLGALGANGTRDLSEQIQRMRRLQQDTGNPDAFSDRQTAQAMLNIMVDQIGLHNLEIIVSELKHVAKTVANNPARVTYLDEVLEYYRVRYR